ncbi:phosphate ABC transporter substrate-binding protein [uncultured Paraglaciecola sp.]|uniref:phosphate ABC transporter substrate-binding protein n=1 Tax=uncultured Paraglaciecola sp. TaxID=1765024 RepID=UPI0030DA9FED|tara:strand:+ start:57255 stop:57683 length:429 start_codon:yes stop_codon:yes gene_type:complete
MSIKSFLKTLIGIAAGCSISLYSLADVVVIVHPSNDAALSQKDVQRIFLGKEKKFSNGKEVLPINQVPSSNARGSFDTDTLGRSSTQIAAYWSKLVFTGKGIPPKELDNDAEVLAIVADNQNAIGYVDSASVSDAVKVISLN